jgi:hypothetical protein
VCFGFWFLLLSQCIFVCIFFIEFCHYPVCRFCFYYSLSPWIKAPKFSTPLRNSSFSSSSNILFCACFGSFFLNCMLVQLFLQGFQSMSVLFFYALLKLGTAFRSIFVLPQLLTLLLTVLSPLDSYTVFF